MKYVLLYDLKHIIYDDHSYVTDVEWHPTYEKFDTIEEANQRVKQILKNTVNYASVEGP